MTVETVTSHERLGTIMALDPGISAAVRLDLLLKFDAADLRANQAGQLSERQRRQMLRRAWAYVAYGSVYYISLAAIGAGLYTSGLRTFAVLLCVVVGAVGVLLLRGTLKAVSEYKSPEVNVVEGQVRRVALGTDETYDEHATLSYYLEISGSESHELFQVSHLVFWTFPEGGPYRIHFTVGNHILSIEPMLGWAAWWESHGRVPEADPATERGN